MTATAFERDARRFINAYLHDGNLKFSNTYVDSKTKDDKYRAEFMKVIVDAVLDQQQGGNMIFSARSHADSLDMVVQSAINQFTGNKLVLRATRELLGYSAQLNLYVREHQVPITPVMRAVTDLVTERDLYLFVPDARTRDAHFYLGLTAPDVNAVQRIPIVEAPPADPSATQAFNQGTE